MGTIYDGMFDHLCSFPSISLCMEKAMSIVRKEGIENKESCRYGNPHDSLIRVSHKNKNYTIRSGYKYPFVVATIDDVEVPLDYPGTLRKFIRNPTKNFVGQRNNIGYHARIVGVLLDKYKIPYTLGTSNYGTRVYLFIDGATILAEQIDYDYSMLCEVTLNRDIGKYKQDIKHLFASENSFEQFAKEYVDNNLTASVPSSTL